MLASDHPSDLPREDIRDGPGAVSPNLPRLDWRRHALFLDFDGTLAPIVPRPEDAAASAETRRAVETIMARTGGAVALLSGRDLTDLDARIAPLKPPAAGSHGVVRRDAAGRLRRDEASGEELAEATARVEDFARRHGLLVERKAGAVTVHYRAQPDAAAASRALADEIVAATQGLRAIHGNMVSEIAVLAANKGHALDAFMAEPPFAGRIPVMAGDDTTDEDAFRAAQRHGGIGLKIGAGPTAATHRAATIDDFLAWLHGAAPG